MLVWDNNLKLNAQLSYKVVERRKSNIIFFLRIVNSMKVDG